MSAEEGPAATTPSPASRVSSGIQNHSTTETQGPNPVPDEQQPRSPEPFTNLYLLLLFTLQVGKVYRFPVGHFRKGKGLVARDSHSSCLSHRGCGPPWDYNEDILRVGTLSYPPFIDWDANNKTPSSPEELRGLEGSILKELSRKLNFSVEFVLPNDGLWGELSQNGTWTGLRGLVDDGLVHVAYSEIALCRRRFHHTNMDHSFSYIDDCLMFITRPPRPYPGWMKVVNPWNWTVWLTMLGVLFSASLIIGHLLESIGFGNAMFLFVRLFTIQSFYHGHDHIGHQHAQGHAHMDESLKDQCKQEESDKYSKTSASQMNMRGVFLHVFADALGSVIVIVSAAIIWQTDWKYRFYLDPALSILMVILIMKSVWPLLVESAMILLQTVPTHIDMDRIKQQLLAEVNG
ncbi:unnamed protein product [Darwinula stevensoni]|uniref:Ionotropic glutamate receptor L-glutamate and glycine-binding domain-containing protein n=1 Tax=Darwinula stevensoni TaxID=69355 RepID=A0A7R8X5X0_9CRUS|nr:unnamed protein product [Darwinula stevensoni]CAG0878940.1 unnamed protein product [Darwinula stevensoni]